jgi:hypothetical protein
LIANLSIELLENSSIKDNDRAREFFNLLSTDISKSIISKAIYLNRPLSADEVKDANKITIKRYLHILENVGILLAVSDKNSIKFEITPVGKEIAEKLKIFPE